MTIIILIVTAAISIFAFQNRELFLKLQFNAYQVVQRKEFYRLLSHGFIHAGWTHLAVNLFVLYIFGRNVEAYLGSMQREGIISNPNLWYLGFYLSGIIFSSTISLVKHRENYYYNAVGASGAVSAMLFFFIFF
jgi:membrane associated rhomboid family serine protease